MGLCLFLYVVYQLATAEISQEENDPNDIEVIDEIAFYNGDYPHAYARETEEEINKRLFALKDETRP